MTRQEYMQKLVDALSLVEDTGFRVVAIVVPVIPVKGGFMIEGKGSVVSDVPAEAAREVMRNALTGQASAVHQIFPSVPS